MTSAFFCSELNPREQEPLHEQLISEVYQMKHREMLYNLALQSVQKLNTGWWMVAVGQEQTWTIISNKITNFAVC